MLLNFMESYVEARLLVWTQGWTPKVLSCLLYSRWTSYCKLWPYIQGPAVAFTVTLSVSRAKCWRGGLSRPPSLMPTTGHTRREHWWWIWRTRVRVRRRGRNWQRLSSGLHQHKGWLNYHYQTWMWPFLHIHYLIIVRIINICVVG